MMKHVKYYCPHCGFRLPKLPYTPLNCPFIPCPDCRNIIRITLSEPALKPYHKITMFKQILTCICGAALLSLIFAFLPTMIIAYIRVRTFDATITTSDVLIGYAITFFICLLLMIPLACSGLDNARKKNYICWLRSNRRLMNHDYALLLKSMGYKVPKRYLNFDKDKLGDFAETAYQKILCWFAEMKGYSESDDWIITYSKNELTELRQLRDIAMTQSDDIEI